MKIHKSKFINRTTLKGFTLIEMLIYMGVLTLLLSVLMAIFSIVLDSRLESESMSGVQQDARYIINRLEYDIKSAQSITTPATKGSSSSTLVLVKNVSGSNVTYTYSIDISGNLSLVNDQGTNILNSYSTSITSASFLRLGNVTGGKDLIQFSITLRSKVLKRNVYESKTVKSTIGLR